MSNFVLEKNRLVRENNDELGIASYWYPVTEQVQGIFGPVVESALFQVACDYAPDSKHALSLDEICDIGAHVMNSTFHDQRIDLGTEELRLVFSTGKELRIYASESCTFSKQ